MTVSANVAIRFNAPDRQALKELARRLQRNQSDTVRLLVRETLAVLKEQDKAEKSNNKATKQ